MKLLFVALIIGGYLGTSKTNSLPGNTNTNATTPINSGSITPESSKTLNPPEGSIIPETEPTSLTEEETTPQAGNQDPSKGNTNTNAATPINSGSITPESGKTTPPEGSIIPETEPTSPTADETQLWNSVPSNSRQWKITLLVFSGLPDPEWVVNSKNRQIYEKIGMLFSNAIKAKEIYEPERMPSKLGYKGFLLKAGKEGPGFLILGDETKELQNVLLQSIPERLISDDLMVGILKEIKKGGILPAEMIVDLELQNDGELAKRWPPRRYSLWTRFLWNNFYIRPNNNCYNYAIDRFTNTFAQPGRINAINLQRPLIAQNVKDAAIADGLQPLNQEPLPGAGALAAVPLNPNQHLVALVVFARDFHWYRLDRNGQWSHKPGQTRITNLDNSNNIISDPRTANIYPYVFHCFMIVDSNHVAIR